MALLLKIADTDSEDSTERVQHWGIVAIHTPFCIINSSGIQYIK